MSEQSETMKELAARYAEAYDNREAGILAFLDDEGELKEGNSYEAYDEHSYDAWNDSHGDLGSLLSELGGLIGKAKKLTEMCQAREAAREGATSEVNNQSREDLGALLRDLSALLG
ncbi:hypothetical protein [Streptomyces sp. NBC_01506]|uniref:hypothetical protein n=1 Tax=Streptomyces sp. NBC_01506 TaxID=2903887 RepID=UPI0038676A02